MIRFDDQVAIVTGAGAGLGREYALLLASRGAKVVVNDPGTAMDGAGSGSASIGAAVVQEILAAGGEAMASTESVARPDGVERLVAGTLERWGRVDILVNNAGILRTGRLAAMALADIEAMIGVHLMGPLYCTRAVLPHMLEAGYGRIVLTSSGVGMLGLADHGIYAAAKSAMLGLMESIKQECAGRDVQINTISPTADTRMARPNVPAHLLQHLAPSLVAPMVAWLASRQCQESGVLVSSGGGCHYRLGVFRAPGVQFDPAQPVSVEEIDANWRGICDMAQAEPFLGTLAGLQPHLRSLGRL